MNRFVLVGAVVVLGACTSEFGPIRGADPGAQPPLAGEDEGEADSPADPLPSDDPPADPGIDPNDSASPADPAAPVDPGAADELVGFKFVYSGDSRDQDSVSATTSRSMAAIPGVQLAVSGGDVTNGNPFDEVVTAFSPLLDAGIPVIMAQGNHDDGGDEYVTFQSDYLGIAIQTKYWSYEATPRVTFLLLDSVQEHGQGSAQYDWFVNQVEACARDHKLCIPVNHHGHLNSEKGNADRSHGRDLYDYAAAQPRSVVPFILSSHSHNVEVLAYDGLPEIICGAWGVGSVMSRSIGNDQVNPDTSCLGVSHVYAFLELEIVSDNEILVTIRKQNGEVMTPDDGLQPIASDHVGQFSVFLDRPFECP